MFKDMKKLFVSIIALCALLSSCTSELEAKLNDVLTTASQTYYAKALDVEKSRGACPFAFLGGEMTLAQDENMWAGGYFMGSLWLLSQWCEDAELQTSADVLTYRYRVSESAELAELLSVVNVAHFNGYQVTKNPRYEEAMGMLAKVMSNTFYNTYCMMKPLGNDADVNHCIAINCMPAIECFHEMGWEHNLLIHGKNMMKFLSRDNGSVKEGVVLSKETGEWVDNITIYSESENSAWARGQAWALYGNTMLYRLTKDEVFLKHSKKVADYIIKNLPQDGVPNWDFTSDKLQKDSSAAAIMASAFIDLYGLTKDKAYLQVAEQQLATLSSEEYLAKADECGGFLLKHGVENYPQGKFVDASLVYGDYYFIEAMIRYLNR